MAKYNPQEIETKWQAYWEEHQTFKTGTDKSKPKYYCLDMFPYPSGAGFRLVRTRPSRPRRTVTISAARSSVLALATTGTRKSTPPTRSITSGRSGFSSAFTAPGSMKTSRRAAPSKNSRFLPMWKQRARKKFASTRIRSASLTTPTLRCGGASTARLSARTKKS